MFIPHFWTTYRKNGDKRVKNHSYCFAGFEIHFFLFLLSAHRHHLYRQSKYSIFTFYCPDTIVLSFRSLYFTGLNGAVARIFLFVRQPHIDTKQRHTEKMRKLRMFFCYRRGSAATQTTHVLHTGSGKTANSPAAAFFSFQCPPAKSLCISRVSFASLPALP